ncbi:hypothetical protein ABZ891_23115 [Streptomyces sp. NPDC047023]|uniref:hypothetical protein n=1 Tax=Streptomyces sp. NPDC047023 TaxID=3155139 RepID=UPI0033E25A95
MSILEEQPSLEDALARARAVAKDIVAVLDEPPGSEPICPDTEQRQGAEGGAAQRRRPRRDARALSRVRHSDVWLW